MAPSAIAGDTDVSLQTWAAEAPVTAERKLNVDLQEEMHKPYLARAIVAADPAHPDGTVGHEHGNMSVLQQHVAFFDRNHDGVVYPWETYQGLRAIGCGVLLSIAGSFLINLSLSYFTVPGCLPNPLLPIYIKNIHKCKHGSDSESYDTEGRFVPDKFDAIFSKYATAHADALTEDELNKMLKANRNIYDFNGWIMSYTEWKLLYWLAKDEERLLHRDAVRGVYDGSVFEYLEKQNADSHKKKA